jgi:DNA-binding transcriptional ArsR family regulator
MASRRHHPFRNFEGFTEPTYTQVPDEFLDKMLPYLSGAETKIMLYLFRKTLGYKKFSDRLSLSQIANGCRRRTGEPIDEGSGLSRSTVAVALKSLEKKGLIVVARMQTQAGDSDMNVYSVRWRREGVVRKSDHPSPESGPPGNPESGPPTVVTKIESSKIQLSTLAAEFLAAIGYTKASPAKRERALRILLHLSKDGFSVDELRAACDIAASVGARGPELIPHVIGRTPETSSALAIGERLTRAQGEEHERWQELADRFDSLPQSRRRELISRARASNPIVARRPGDHPLLRAAAIALLDDREAT